MTPLKRFTFLEILTGILAVCSLLLTSRADAGLGIEYFDLPGDGGRPGYRIALIRNSAIYGDTNNTETSPFENLRGLPARTAGDALKLASRARDWSFEQFGEVYPEYTKEEFEELKQKDHLEDARSTRVVVMKAGSEEIVATLKLVYDDLKTDLPFDEVFGRIPRWKPVFKKFAEYDPSTSSYDKSATALTGGIVQLMEFVIEKSARADLNAVLHMAAEWDLWLKANEDMPKVRVSQRLQPTGLSDQKTIFGPFDAKMEVFALVPDNYILYCDARLLPYYESLGFSQFIRKGKLFGMRMDRERFTQITEQSPYFRRAYDNLDAKGMYLDLSHEGDPNARASFFPAGSDPTRHGLSRKEIHRQKVRCQAVFMNR